MAVTKSLGTAQTMAARAVHLKITPAPSDIRQSREILKLLKGYGEVTMFRNLKYDRTNRAKDAVLAVFRTSDSASDILRASPIRFTLLPEKPYNPVSVASARLGELFAEQPEQTHDGHEEENVGVEFEVLADKSFIDHQALVQRKRNYWGYVPEKSFVHDALKPDVPLPGLASMPPAHDLEQRSRIVKKKLEAVAARKTLRQMREEAMSQTT